MAKARHFLAVRCLLPLLLPDSPERSMKTGVFLHLEQSSKEMSGIIW